MLSQHRFLLVHPLPQTRAYVLHALQQQPDVSIQCCAPDTAVTECSDKTIDLVLLHLPESRPESLELLQRLGTLAPVFLIHASDPSELVTAVLTQVHRYSRGPAPVSNCLSSDEPRHLLGETESMRKLRNYVTRVARSECSVLITGETGTGKDLVAHMIHQESARFSKPFVCVNCAAVPDGLFESELFGHERGAFTGASCARDGRMRQANGGTLFLDEIGEMTPLVQAKLLRAIETKELQRIGARRTTTVDVRIVAATNQDLQTLVAAGGFRKDLYFRLNVARVLVPPLRTRREDIPLLLDAHLRQLNRHYGTDIRGFSDLAMQIMLAYDWPGNVRELRNTLEATMVNVRGHWIEAEDLPDELQSVPKSMSATEDDGDRRRLLDALQICQWNKAKAARQLQWSRMTLYRKIAKYQIAGRCPEPMQSANAADTDINIAGRKLVPNVP